MYSRFLIPVVAITVCVLVGCSKSDRPMLVSVSGTVTLDGEPVDHAHVSYQPMSNEVNRGAIGFTNSNGYYQLYYITDRGCPPGKFNVLITNRGNKLDDDGKVTGFNEGTIPERYSNPNKPMLTAHVEANGSNTFNFALTSK